MNNDLVIRTATDDDADTIAQFNRSMAAETEDKPLDPDTVQAGVQALLDNPSRGFYLVAERDGAVVGSLMITTEWSDWRNGAFWWVQSVYVRPEARRQGVYAALYRHVKAQAADTGHVCGLRLYVERTNTGAQHAYRARGMSETSYRLYEEMLD